MKSVMVEPENNIETAPKIEGKHLLMFGDGANFKECWFIGAWKGNEWIEVFDRRPAFPIHWRDLPV